jgi:hypothetical protein
LLQLLLLPLLLPPLLDRACFDDGVVFIVIFQRLPQLIF